MKNIALFFIADLMIQYAETKETTFGYNCTEFEEHEIEWICKFILSLKTNVEYENGDFITISLIEVLTCNLDEKKIIFRINSDFFEYMPEPTRKDLK